MEAIVPTVMYYILLVSDCLSSQLNRLTENRIQEVMREGKREREREIERGRGREGGRGKERERERERGEKV